MTLNDHIRKAQALAKQFSSGDVPLDKDIDFEIATYKGEMFGIIVDVKEPRTMSKAEQRALEAYPQNEVIVYGPLPGANEPNRIDDNLKYRIGYIEGYNQAEKDLGWISVKDRLPEEGHFVLTCVDDSGTPQSVGMALFLKDGTWWDGDMKVYVDYWMEVPKLKK